MKGTITGVCLAAAMGFAATLGAQAPATTTTATPDKSDREITLTGCLTKTGDDYMLMNARADEGKSSTTTTAGATTTGGAVGTSGVDTPMMWKLSDGNDLDKHVGHKITVTGKAKDADHPAAAVTATHRAGLRELFEGLCRQARIAEPHAVALLLTMLYDAAIITAYLDRDQGAAATARAAAEALLQHHTAPV